MDFFVFSAGFKNAGLGYDCVRLHAVVPYILVDRERLEATQRYILELLEACNGDMQHGELGPHAAGVHELGQNLQEAERANNTEQEANKT